MTTPEPTLNLGILAHVDAGKTSLTERLLYEAGVVADLGSVDAGDTQTDTMALERRRGITIRSAVASFRVDGLAVNLVDTPGHSDFVAEVERALAVLDGCVLVVSAVEGVQAQTLVLFRALRRLGIPTVFFVNKVDRGNADPARVVGEIRRAADPAHGMRRVGQRRGLADGAAVTRHREPRRSATSSPTSTTRSSRRRSASDPHTRAAQLLRRLGEQTAAGRAYPVLFGSAITGAGVPELMRLLPDLLPPPPPDPAHPSAGVVFAIRRGDAGEKLVQLRVASGTLRVRDRIDLGHGREERVTALQGFTDPAARRRRQRWQPGRSAWCAGWSRPASATRSARGPRRSSDQFVRPSLETVVDPVDPADRVALYAALGQLAEQDPLIDVRQDDGRREVAVSLYGEVQKEVVGSLLETDYGVPVTFRESTPICVERLVGAGADHELIGMTSNPFLATVGLRVEPAPLGAGSPSASRSSSARCRPRSSRRSRSRCGPRSSRVRTGGRSPTARSPSPTPATGAATASATPTSPRACRARRRTIRCLAPLVLMTALARARTTVCVPVHRFELEIPEGRYASVLAALPRLAATPLTTRQSGAHLVVEGTVPAVAVHALQQRVPDLTSGEGLLTTRLDHFAPAVGPPPTRPRTDDDPTDRVNYLKTTTRRVGRQ